MVMFDYVTHRVESGTQRGVQCGDVLITYQMIWWDVRTSVDWLHVYVSCFTTRSIQCVQHTVYASRFDPDWWYSSQCVRWSTTTKPKTDSFKLVSLTCSFFPALQQRSLITLAGGYNIMSFKKHAHSKMYWLQLELV